jgi:superfamily II DNA or RNA helicase
VELEFDYTLDTHDNAEWQNGIVSAIYNRFIQAKYYDGCIIGAQMGSGKTVIALKLAAKLKLKTLIIVHRKILLEQWIQMIQKFLHIPQENIGIIDAEAVICDKPITVAMLQSLLSKELPQDFKYQFSLVIVDESSHIGAPEWWKISQLISPKYTLGLTGTPSMKDLKQIMFYVLGMDIYGNLKSKVQGRVIQYPFTLYFAPSKTYQLFEKDSYNRLVKCAYIRSLIKNNDYTALLFSIIKTYLLEGRKILVVTCRVHHAKFIFNAVTKLYPDKKAQLIIGGVKTIFQDCDIYIGTDAYISEGLDIPSLDTLILATPIERDIKQTIGRLFRNVQNKQIIIADIDLDGIPQQDWLIKYSAIKRNIFKSLGLTVERYVYGAHAY